MYELIKVAENSYYIESPAKIGLITLSDNEAVIIDSGNDKSAGKRIKRILDENRWKLKAIFNTHSHADHIGGNRYLQTQTGCDIYACGIEAAFTQHPILEPTYLFGANPPAELRHKFLMAEASDVKELHNDIIPTEMEVVPLPGHSFDMVGFKTSDEVIYLGDCLSSKETIEKYKIGFLTDVNAYLKTLETVCELEAECFIPSHAEATDDIVPLAKINIDTVLKTGERIIDICKEPKTFEELLAILFNEYCLNMNFEQYALIGSTVKSYLTWLKSTEKIQAEIFNNKIIWKRI